MEAAPEASVGHVAECVSKGRLALWCDNRTKVRRGALPVLLGGHCWRQPLPCQAGTMLR